jgi:hypothetical protein
MKLKVSIMALVLMAGVAGCANPDGSPRYVLPEGSREAAGLAGGVAGGVAGGPGGAAAGTLIIDGLWQILAALGVIGTGGTVAYAHSRGRHIGWEERQTELDKQAAPK